MGKRWFDGLFSSLSHLLGFARADETAQVVSPPMPWPSIFAPRMSRTTIMMTAL